MSVSFRWSDGLFVCSDCPGDTCDHVIGFIHDDTYAEYRFLEQHWSGFDPMPEPHDAGWARLEQMNFASLWSEASGLVARFQEDAEAAKRFVRLYRCLLLARIAWPERFVFRGES